jgi:hypothetical protein
MRRRGLALIVFAACGAASPAAVAAVGPSDPFASPGMRAYLQARGGNVTAAVLDLLTGRISLWRPRLAEHTASIVKADILQTLLHELHGRPIPGPEVPVATGMIEHSDNSDATQLWNAVGGAPAVAAYDRLVGMTGTVPASSWGLTDTTALDQVRLLRELVGPPSLLDAGARDFQLGLMEHIESDQAWGVTGGVPPGVTVALKNGWLPESGGWQINSIGWVQGDGRSYLVAVMSSGNPSMAYGIGTISGISARVFAALAPWGGWAPAAPVGAWGPA